MIFRITMLYFTFEVNPDRLIPLPCVQQVYMLLYINFYGVEIFQSYTNTNYIIWAT